MQELLGCSALQQALLIRNRKLSSRELVEASLRQIGKVNPHINAVVELWAERALAQARAADEALARGEATGPPSIWVHVQSCVCYRHE